MSNPFASESQKIELEKLKLHRILSKSLVKNPSFSSIAQEQNEQQNDSTNLTSVHKTRSIQSYKILPGLTPIASKQDDYDSRSSLN
jgi:hypothetical protein